VALACELTKIATSRSFGPLKRVGVRERNARRAALIVSYRSLAVPLPLGSEDLSDLGGKVPA
jgi:hypothetical protein